MTATAFCRTACPPGCASGRDGRWPNRWPRRPRRTLRTQKSAGSMISVFQSAYCAALAALRLWVSRSQVHPAGCVIRKPPYSPPLCWRQDGGGRNDPLSYAAPTRQFFLLYCLVNAEPANSCLRVLRGSRRRPAMRDLAPEARAEARRRAADPAHPALRSPDGRRGRAGTGRRGGERGCAAAAWSLRQRIGTAAHGHYPLAPPLRSLFRSLAGL